MDINLVRELQEFEKLLLTYNVGDKEIHLIGFLLVISLIIVIFSKKIKVPIVVGYVFIGILLSMDIIDSLPFLSIIQKEWYRFTVENLDYISNIALAFIAFTIGNELSIKIFKALGKSIVYIVILQAFSAFALVTLALFVIGQPLFLSLLLGAIASATAPAATVMVIREYNAKGPVTSMIMSVVGIDDAVALILFSLVNPLAYILYSGEGSISFANSLLHPLIEITGSIGIGFIIGYISQYYITITEDKTKKILTLMSTIIAGTSLSILFNFSPLITNMTVGFVYRNFTRKNPGIGGFLETITIPLYALFFILAGTEIRFTEITSFSFIILAFTYTVARVVGKIGGTYLGAILANASENIKKYVGLGLLPQSGVAIALAYTVQSKYSTSPKIGLLIFNIILFTAAFTEIFGSLATKYALFKSGEAETDTK